MPTPALDVQLRQLYPGTLYNLPSHRVAKCFYAIQMKLILLCYVTPAESEMKLLCMNVTCAGFYK